MQGMTWLSFELMQCGSSVTELCGGVQRVTSSSDSIRCYLGEMSVMAMQSHLALLDGSEGWARAGRDMGIVSDWQSPCTVFTPEEDLFVASTNLGAGVGRTSDLMNQFSLSTGM